MRESRRCIDPARAPLRGVVWDFDLTLVDTRARNLEVTRRIVQTLTGRPPEAFPVLGSVERYDAVVRRYRNWQELYEREFGLRPERLPEAGRLWAGFQLDARAPVRVFQGVAAALEALRSLPHAIVSLNARRNIERTLGEAGLLGFFETIIGYEEVGFHRQKPSPEGLLLAVERWSKDRPGHVFFVGDHDTDAECAALANERLARAGTPLRVVSVAAAYGATDVDRWRVRPDHTIRRPSGILALARRYGVRPGRAASASPEL